VLKRTPELILETGVLWLGPKEEQYLRSTIGTLRELGVRHEVLDAESVNAKYAQLHVESSYMGILEVDSCTILARRAVNAVVERAVELGVEYRTAFVTQPEVNGHLAEIKTGCGDTIRADHFVFACGPWLPKVFPKVVGDQIEPTRQEEFYFAAPAGDTSYAPDAFPSWVDFRSEAIFYGCPSLEYRGVKVAADAHGRAIDPDTEDRVPSPAGLSAVRGFLHERFPKIASSACVETRVCQYENSTSGDFLIDRHPFSPNVWIAGGGSGHGFKHGPAVGEYVASLVAGGPMEPRFTLRAASKQINRDVH
jgi:glycine/D-amino acid oxidase-like deaminating enzyme